MSTITLSPAQYGTSKNKNKTKKQNVSRAQFKTADLKIENMFSMELIHTIDQKMEAIIWCNIPA